MFCTLLTLNRYHANTLLRAEFIESPENEERLPAQDCADLAKFQATKVQYITTYPKPVTYATLAMPNSEVVVNGGSEKEGGEKESSQSDNTGADSSGQDGNTGSIEASDESLQEHDKEALDNLGFDTDEKV